MHSRSIEGELQFWSLNRLNWFPISLTTDVDWDIVWSPDSPAIWRIEVETRTRIIHSFPDAIPFWLSFIKMEIQCWSKASRVGFEESFSSRVSSLRKPGDWNIGARFLEECKQCSFILLCFHFFIVFFQEYSKKKLVIWRLNSIISEHSSRWAFKHEHKHEHKHQHEQKRNRLQTESEFHDMKSQHGHAILKIACPAGSRGIGKPLPINTDFDPPSDAEITLTVACGFAGKLSSLVSGKPRGQCQWCFIVSPISCLFASISRRLRRMNKSRSQLWVTISINNLKMCSCTVDVSLILGAVYLCGARALGARPRKHGREQIPSS